MKSASRVYRSVYDTIARMIIDGVLITSPEARLLIPSNFLTSFLSFIERRLNVTIVRDIRTLPHNRPDLADALHIVQVLKERGVLQSVQKATPLPDEPPFRRWSAICNSPQQFVTTGASPESDRDALFATLGEALERYLWAESVDHFVAPIRARVSEIREQGAYIDPVRFAGLSNDDRRTRHDGTLRSDSSFLWIRGTSLVNNAAVYVPAQTVSGVAGLRAHAGTIEPLIRSVISTGVATWSTRTGARLRGALEVIERDAYMITWLNQITPSRIALDSFRSAQTSFARLVARCERYGLRVHMLRLVTDAPTYAISCVLEDMSSVAPRFAFGLKAQASLERALEGALVEALRARAAYRRLFAHGEPWNPATPVREIGQYDRLFYWAQPEHAGKLEFLIRGKLHDTLPEPWDSDTDEQHLTRIITWCAEKKYECASVSIGTSKKNPLPWHTEAVVIPEMQPTYLSEQFRQVYGERLFSVPVHMGYTARKEPFVDAPHPFA